MNRKYGLLGLGILLGLGAILVAWYWMDANYVYNGTLIDPPPAATDFSLTNQFGEPFQLSQQHGKIVLIFFGYTNCPDVCPVTLTVYKQVRQRLDEKADDVELLYITVDPERDTQERLREHLKVYDPAVIGLTGSPEALRAVYNAYGVYAAKVDTGSAAGYQMDHTSRIYVIDQQGNWRLTYPFGIEADQVADDLLHLLRQ